MKPGEIVSIEVEPGDLLVANGTSRHESVIAIITDPVILSDLRELEGRTVNLQETLDKRGIAIEHLRASEVTAYGAKTGRVITVRVVSVDALAGTAKLRVLSSQQPQR